MNDRANIAVSNDRRLFVGGSDIPKIIGVSPYGDQFSLYLEKIGELDPPEIETKVQRRGKILEPAIVQMYADDTGRNALGAGVCTISESPPFRAQVDAQESIDGGRRMIPLEIKSVSEFTRGKWGASGTDDAPTAYCAQLHWQMLAMDAPFGRIVALLGADDLRVYTIERDPKVDEFLLERAAEFWSRVQDRRPPTIDFDHPSVADTLARLFRNPRATEILQATDAHRAWRDVLIEATARAKEYDAVREGARAHLLAEMGNAGAINFGENLYVRKVVKRKAYEVAASEYIDARIVRASSKAGLPALTEEIAT